MDEKENSFSDENYPIEPIWALKSTLISLLSFPFLIVLFIFFFQPDFLSQSSHSASFKGNSYIILFIIFTIFSTPVHFFTNVLRRATFHYGFKDKFLSLHQGIIKKQNRELPFGIIQNVIVTRGPLDRIFGLSTLTIQNATQSSLQDLKAQAAGSAGFFGNTIQIPGLSKENGEIVKNAILKKVKDSPTVELGM